MSADRIADAIRDVLLAGSADTDRKWPAGWCERCGCDDGTDALAGMIHPATRGTIRARRVRRRGRLRARAGVHRAGRGGEITYRATAPQPGGVPS